MGGWAGTAREHLNSVGADALVLLWTQPYSFRYSYGETGRKEVRVHVSPL